MRKRRGDVHVYDVAVCGNTVRNVALVRLLVDHPCSRALLKLSAMSQCYNVHERAASAWRQLNDALLQIVSAYWALQYRFFYRPSAFYQLISKPASTFNAINHVDRHPKVVHGDFDGLPPSVKVNMSRCLVRFRQSRDATSRRIVQPIVLRWITQKRFWALFAAASGAL